MCYIREFQSNSNVLYLINCGLLKAGGGGVARFWVKCKANGQGNQLPQEEWQLLPVKYTGHGELSICSSAEGYPAQKRSYQHAFEEVYHYENVQKSQLLQ